MSQIAYFTWSEISLGKRAAILKLKDEIVRYLCKTYQMDATSAELFFKKKKQ